MPILAKQDRALAIALWAVVAALLLCWLFPPSASLVPREAVAQFHQADLSHNNCCCNANAEGSAPSSQEAVDLKPTSPRCCCHTIEKSPQPPRWSLDWWFDSPVTVFTGFLVVVGVLQAIFLWLGFSESRRASDAANKSANALIASQRAYISLKAAPIELKNENGQLLAMQGIVIWENSGTTPTKDLRTWVNWAVYENPLPDDFDFADAVSDTVAPSLGFIGPKSAIQTTTFTLTQQDLIALSTGTKFLYMWGWATYHDIFPGTPLRRFEFCNEVAVRNVLGGAGFSIEFRFHRGHNSST
jgi:hypothetical protein